MDLWNYTDLARLAPDPATMKDARGVSFALKNWQVLAGNEKIVWGEYTGRGHQCYQVAADLEQARFYCTCRSPRFPCKHALALPLLLMRSNEEFRVSYELPDWLKRAWSAHDKPRKKARISEAPSDERLLLMQSGLAELESRLLQLIEQGLAAVGRQDHQFWEGLAVRMTDSKLPGPAARIRALLKIEAGDQWHEEVLALLADLYLLIRAFKRYDHLPDGLQQELLNAAGVTVRRDRVLAEPAHADRWMVLGAREGEESENLYYRRTWLLAEGSGQQALLLDFNWNQQGYREHWPPGMIFDGKVHYYPGNYPLRAVVGDFQVTTEPLESLSGIFQFRDLSAYLSRALAGNPWAPVLPCLLVAVQPHFENNRQWLIDPEAQAFEIKVPEQVFWKMMSVSGGHPISLFGEWENDNFRPLTVVEAERVVELQG